MQEVSHDELVAAMLAPGSGWVSADGKTEQHAQEANERLWERELAAPDIDTDEF
jgi:hypothetical protein